MSSPNTPNTPKPPKKPEAFSVNLSIRHAWMMRIGIMLVLTIGAGMKMCGGATKRSYEMSDVEKTANEIANRSILKNGGKLAETGNAIQKGKPHAEGEVVLMEWPGKRKKRIMVQTGENEFMVKKEKADQEPQLIPMPESCVAQAEEFRRCINRTLRADPKGNYGWRSNALQEALKTQMKDYTSDAIVVSKGGPHNRICALDISSFDAVKEDLAYATDANGHAMYLKDLEDKDEARRIALEASGGLVGLHDLAMECGMEVGLIGGYCGIGRDPWHYESIYTMSPNDVRRQPCERGDKRWTANREKLRKNPPRDLLGDLDLKYELTKIMLKKGFTKAWEGVKEASEKAWEGVKGLFGNKDEE